DLSIRYHAAVWSPGDGSPTDLTPMTLAVQHVYFDDISFIDMPNDIPMSWTANGVNSIGVIAGMVTRNKGLIAPGANGMYGARWNLSFSPVTTTVQFFNPLPSAPDLKGFDSSAYGISETGVVAGSTLYASLALGADPRNQNDHYHAFSSTGT